MTLEQSCLSHLPNGPSFRLHGAHLPSSHCVTTLQPFHMEEINLKLVHANIWGYVRPCSHSQTEINCQAFGCCGESRRIEGGHSCPSLVDALGHNESGLGAVLWMCLSCFWRHKHRRLRSTAHNFCCNSSCTCNNCRPVAEPATRLQASANSLTANTEE